MKLQFFFEGCRYFNETDIFLCFQNIEGFLAEFRSHNHFEENRFHGFCCRFVADLVHGYNAAESRFAVCVEGTLESIERIFAKSCAAGIGMFDNNAGRLVFAPFAYQVPGCFHVHNVVVGQFLAMKLFSCSNAAFGFRILIECSFLMRVLAVTEILELDEGFAIYIRQTVFISVHFLGEVVCNGTVIEAGVKECFSGQFQTEIFIQGIILNPFQDFAVLGWIHHDGHVFVVLCCRTNHGRTADIDIFNGFCSGYVWFGNGFTERIEVHSHQINAFDAVFLHSFHMFRIITDSEDASVNLGMQCFHTAIHHFRKSGHFGNRFYRNACCCNGLHGTAGGNDFHTQFMKSFCKFYDPCLIRYTDQGSFNCHI